MCLWERGPHATASQHLGFPFVWVWACFANGLLSRIGCPTLGLCVLVLFIERNTSITTSQESEASNPSIRSPNSNEMTSDSVEQWETDDCLLHIQLMGTNVRLPKQHEIPPPEFD